MDSYKVAVIGAGAAGCACASRLIDADRAEGTVIIEKGDRICRKLSASGNGQGNISNADMGPGHYFGSCGSSFLARTGLLFEYSPESLFHVKTFTDEKGRIYPYSRQASCLGDMFYRKITGSGVKLVFGDGAADIRRSDGGFVVTLSSGRLVRAESVVLCTGGAAAPQFGTDGSAYSLAAGMGHGLVNICPSLVQLKTGTADIRGLKGIRLDCGVEASDEKKILARYRGDVIFTDYGVSGNAVFYISAFVADRLPVTLRLDLVPDFTEEELGDYLAKKRAFGCGVDVAMSGLVHNRVAKNVAARAEREGKPAENVLKNFTLPVTGSLGFDCAQVTKGGIPGSEITDGLESRLATNLYFAGEILDADGECGGYNLHFAFSCGIRAADSIIRKVYD